MSRRLCDLDAVEFDETTGELFGINEGRPEPLDPEQLHEIARRANVHQQLVQALTRVSLAFQRKSYPELQGVACDVFEALRVGVFTDTIQLIDDSKETKP